MMHVMYHYQIKAFNWLEKGNPFKWLSGKRYQSKFSKFLPGFIHFCVFCPEEWQFADQEPYLRGKKEFEQTVFFDELKTILMLQNQHLKHASFRTSFWLVGKKLNQYCKEDEFSDMLLKGKITEIIESVFFYVLIRCNPVFFLIVICWLCVIVCGLHVQAAW